MNALEQSLATLSNRTAPAQELRGAGEQALAAVSEIDAKADLAPQREAEILRAMTSKSLGETLEALEALDKEGEQRALMRKVATHLATALDAGVRERAKFEAERDEARRPFAAQTRRAMEFAEKIVAIYAPNAASIVHLFQDDVLISKMGANTYSALPAPRGTHVSYVRTWHVPRVLAAAVGATKLPEFWPPRYNDFTILEQRVHFEEDDDEIVRPIRALIKRGPTAESEVDAAIARAQALVLAEYRKAADAIGDLLRLDATVTAADRELKYPDHAPVFDPALFPSYWIAGLMNRRVVLPSLDGLARAAE